MTTPKTGKGGGGGGGGGGPTRRGRKDEMPVVIEPTANDDSSSNNNNNNNNNSNNSTNNAAVAQKTGGGMSRLPSIKERRPSVQKKARTASVTEVSSDSSTVATATTATTTPSSTSTTTTTTTTTILQRQESTSTATTSTPTPTIQRRSSVTQGLGLKGGRPTFAGIGRRVSSMVRARMAFQSRRKSVATNAEEVNHMEAIHEMPRNPRFTTFLSAEAQYAMMKGYEDMLYEKIAKTNPESRLVLKRTKTPFHKKISIVDHDNKQQGGGGQKNRTGGSKPLDTTVITTITATSPTPTAAMSPDSEDFDLGDDASADSNANRTTTTLPSPFRKAERSQSTVSSHVSKSMTSSSSSSPRASGGVGFALHRSSSLPTLKTAGLSHQKRLVLTYRLESAMDILDTLKRRNKENSLSPRVYRIPRQVDAVKDFNSWTKVWNKEFKVAHAK